MFMLKLHAAGPEVVSLQLSLRQHGFDPGSVDGDFELATEAAVVAFQKSENLLPDGIVGHATAVALGLPPVPPAADVTAAVTVEMASHMFPATRVSVIAANLPRVLTALHDANLGDRPMVLTALATIRAEAAGFEPIAEAPSRFNTSPHGSAFDLYDLRKDLGNRGAPDGAMFRGRGYIQLTGRANYETYGSRLGGDIDFPGHPDKACDAMVASRLLAMFLGDKEREIRAALLDGDLRAARKLVNGGSHGLNDFTDAFRAGDKVMPRPDR